jgi:GTPase involved in cell partitioning and DNA repair
MQTCIWCMCDIVIYCYYHIANDGPGSRRPSGGHGGEGGDVYIIADKKLRYIEKRVYIYYQQQLHA